MEWKGIFLNRQAPWLLRSKNIGFEGQVTSYYSKIFPQSAKKFFTSTTFNLKIKVDS